MTLWNIHVNTFICQNVIGSFNSKCPLTVFVSCHLSRRSPHLHHYSYRYTHSKQTVDLVQRNLALRIQLRSRGQYQNRMPFTIHQSVIQTSGHHCSQCAESHLFGQLQLLADTDLDMSGVKISDPESIISNEMAVSYIYIYNRYREPLFDFTHTNQVVSPL